MVRLLMVLLCGTLAFAQGGSTGKRHTYEAKNLFESFYRTADGKPIRGEPQTRIDLKDEIQIVYPLIANEMDLIEFTSNNSAIRIGLVPEEKRSIITIRPKEKGTAKLTWRIIEVTGREHQFTLNVTVE